MSNRINISSGTIWEEKVGYSRAVKIGNQVFVSGTVAVDENGKTLGEGNPYEQAKFIFSKIEKALIQAGATLNDVVRTRMFVTDINNFDEITKAHGEVFSNIRPAATLVEISRLVNNLLVEIEVDAIINK